MLNLNETFLGTISCNRRRQERVAGRNINIYILNKEKNRFFISPDMKLNEADYVHSSGPRSNRKLRTFLETKKSLPAGASEG